MACLRVVSIMACMLSSSVPLGEKCGIIQIDYYYANTHKDCREYLFSFLISPCLSACLPVCLRLSVCLSVSLICCLSFRLNVSYRRALTFNGTKNIGEEANNKYNIKRKDAVKVFSQLCKISVDIFSSAKYSVLGLFGRFR